MNKRKTRSHYFFKLFCFFCAGLFFFQISCSKKPIEKKDALDNLKDMCFKKYGFIVTVDQKDKHLIFLTFTEHPFNSDEENQRVSEITRVLQYSLSKIEDKIEFCHIITRDTISGLEKKYVYKIDDLKKYSLSLIDKKEFKKRTLYNIDNNIYLLGKKRLEFFFESLPSQTLDDILRINPQISLKIFSKELLDHLLESSMKRYMTYEILEQKTKAVSQNRMLFYCKVKHSFEKKSTFLKSSFTYPNGSIINFIIGINNASYLSVRISNIYTFNNNISDSKEIPDSIKGQPHPDLWRQQDFYISSFENHDFFAHLIAQRVTTDLLNTIHRKGKRSEIKSIEGSFKINSDKKSLIFLFRPNGRSSGDITFKNVNEMCIENTKTICKIYDFYDFDTIELMLPERGIFKSIRKEDL
ncbi:MAG: hypothetical protein KAI43_02640 [Candidatus Aureabacteria bacterium]|nr:hypothetical protein [Candidatus Auribacterota bacterium]